MKRGSQHSGLCSGRPRKRQSGISISLALFIAAASHAQESSGRMDEAQNLFTSFAPDLYVLASSPYAAAGDEPTLANGTLQTPNEKTATGLKIGSLEFGARLSPSFQPLDSRLTSLTTWSTAFAVARYQPSYLSGLGGITLTPGRGSGLGEYIQMGAGLDLTYADSGLGQFHPWLLNVQSITEPDGSSQIQVDAIGLNGNLSVNVNVSERQRVGLSYRVPVDIDYRGEHQQTYRPTALGGGVFTTESKTSIRFPTVITAGYGIDLSRRFQLAADLQWLQFSRFKDVPLMVANGLPGLPGSVNENWRDSFSIGLGGQYRLGEHWVLRGGYQFYQSPVPDSSVSATAPYAGQNVFTVGVGFVRRNHSLMASYGVDFYDTAAAGELGSAALTSASTSTIHLASFAYRLAF